MERYFSPRKRQEEKEESRRRDELMLARGEISADELNKRNGFFSNLDPSKAVLISRCYRPKRLPGQDCDADL